PVRIPRRILLLFRTWLVPKQSDERERNAVFYGRRWLAWTGALEERRYRGWHRLGQGHSPRPPRRDERRLPRRPHERQWHSVFLSRRRHKRQRVVEERRYRGRHRSDLKPRVHVAEQCERHALLLRQ